MPRLFTGLVRSDRMRMLLMEYMETDFSAVKTRSKRRESEESRYQHMRYVYLRAQFIIDALIRSE